MEIKERILQAALQLFNRSGTDQVSIREIAEELGISDGNLRYHYRTKDALIEALFFQLADKLGVKIAGAMTGEPDMKMMHYLNSYMMEQFYAYRFMLQDFIAVLNRSAVIKRHFRRITRERTLIMKGMIGHYVERGYLVPDLYPGHYDALIENMLINIHFWINGSALFYKGRQKDLLKHYTDLTFSMMYPYFTAKALEELRREGLQ